MQLPEEELDRKLKDVYAKECLCVGLSNSASLVYNVPFVKKLTSVTICPGPNIANFSKVVTLRNMVDHIYGRLNIMTNNMRPHVFVNELNIYVAYFREQVEEQLADVKQVAFNQKFGRKLLEGIAYYRSIEQAIRHSSIADALHAAETEITGLLNRLAPTPAVV